MTKTSVKFQKNRHKTVGGVLHKGPATLRGFDRIMECRTLCPLIFLSGYYKICILWYNLFGSFMKLLLWIFYVFSVLCLLCLCEHLLICALWSPAGKGLTSLLWFVVSICEFVTFPLVSWVRCGTWLYRFLIFAPLLTLMDRVAYEDCADPLFFSWKKGIVALTKEIVYNDHPS